MPKINIKRKIKKFYRQNHTPLVIIGAIVITLTLYFVQISIEDHLEASLLATREASIVFDGTANPIQKVPDWIKFTGNVKTTPYSQISSNELIPLPSYNPAQLAKPASDLVWGNEADNVIRNAKLTYSVVYLGNYKLDGIENAGSHPAVDIRTPKGTPVFAIANGVVTKSVCQSSGFGNHIVIKHPRVPDYPETTKITALYSSYSHLIKLDVTEGDVVKKGQKIGEVGDTGTATTPHLHFQIDRETASWYPFWPFSSTDVKNAGLNFMSAVNAGLKQATAKEYTINPMKYVQSFLDGKYTGPDQGSDTNGDNNTDTDTNDNNDNNDNNTNDNNTDTDTNDNNDNNSNNTNDNNTDTDTNDNNNNNSNNNDTNDDNNSDITVANQPYSLEITGDQFAFIGNPAYITIKAVDENREVIKNFSPNENIKITFEGKGTLSKTNLTKDDFKDGMIRIKYVSKNEETAEIAVNDKKVQVSIIEEIKPALSLEILHDGEFVVNVPEKITVIPLDKEGNPTPGFTYSTPAKITFLEGKGSLNKESLSRNDFANGLAVIELTVPKDVSKVKLKIGNSIVEGTSDTLYSANGLFSDVSKTHKNYKAIQYLKQRNVINGYADGTFKPAQSVNRAEALKILLGGLNIALDENARLDFSDTEKNVWYSDYLRTAVKLDIVNGYPDGTFKPAQTVNRAEYMKILLLTKGVDIPAAVNDNPYTDVNKNAWYAKYALYVKTKNLLESTGNEKILPGNSMTRGEVAEMTYRLLYIEENELLGYSD